MWQGRTIQTSVAISIATYISPYYIVLLPPLALLLRRKQESTALSYFKLWDLFTCETVMLTLLATVSVVAFFQWECCCIHRTPSWEIGNF
eukprot:750526-Hanusia_phi.AAC.2